MWHIENGTLYLNYSAGTNHRFRFDVSGNNARADTNWPDIRSRLDTKASESSVQFWASGSCEERCQ